jgi:hypothetical protein
VESVSGEWVFCFRSFWFPFGTLVYRFFFGSSYRSWILDFWVWVPAYGFRLGLGQRQVRTEEEAMMSLPL